jgi:lipase chaperone LimK
MQNIRHNFFNYFLAVQGKKPYAILSVVKAKIIILYFDSAKSINSE